MCSYAVEALTFDDVVTSAGDCSTSECTSLEDGFTPRCVEQRTQQPRWCDVIDDEEFSAIPLNSYRAKNTKLELVAEKTQQRANRFRKAERSSVGGAEHASIIQKAVVQNSGPDRALSTLSDLGLLVSEPSNGPQGCMLVDVVCSGSAKDVIVAGCNGLHQHQMWREQTSVFPTSVPNVSAKFVESVRPFTKTDMAFFEVHRSTAMHGGA